MSSKEICLKISSEGLAKGLLCKGKDLDSWSVAMASGFACKFNGTKAQALKVLADHKAALAAKEAAKGLGDKVKALKVGKGLTVFAKTAAAAGLRIVVAFDTDSGEASYSVAGKGSSGGSSKRSGATVSGNIAPADAVKWGIKHGDPKDLVDMDAVRAEAKATPGLTQKDILFRDFPTYKCCERLRQFGYQPKG